MKIWLCTCHLLWKGGGEGGGEGGGGGGEGGGGGLGERKVGGIQ